MENVRLIRLAQCGRDHMIDMPLFNFVLVEKKLFLFIDKYRSV